MFSSSELSDLLTKYDGNLPRYASYPTAVELKPVRDLEAVKHALAQVRSKPLSLYVHIPFCPSLCYFCACNKIITQDPAQAESYVKLLAHEARLLSHELGERASLAQLHLGGGSPSYLSAAGMEQLFGILREQFQILADAELSIEIDPRTIDAQKIELLTKNGFTRVSLGVQDFDQKVQEIVHRLQPFELVREVVAMLRDSGIEAINFDLIYGLPGQTEASFDASLEQVIALRPSRIALYGYAHVTWIHKVQRVFEKHNLPGAEERIRLFEKAQQRLGAAGYLFVGLDHFVLPGDELELAARNGRMRRSFMGYTVIPASGVLGLGVSSISDLGEILFQNFVELGEYKDALQREQLPVWKECRRSPENVVRADIIERIMCDRQINFQQLRTRFDSNALVDAVIGHGKKGLSRFAEDGLIIMQDDGFTVTPRGAFFLRHMAACFDPNISGTGEVKKFSQSI